MKVRIHLIFSLFMAISSPIVLAENSLHIDRSLLNSSLQHLATFGSKPQKGTSRIAYSEADKDGRNWVLSEMKKAGLAPYVDAAGNIIGTLAGSDNSLKPIATGSHIDTVPEGGNYDGVVGALAAIEVARTLHNSRQILKHPLRVIVFSNEEGGHIGSRSITSGLTNDDLQFQSLSGKMVAGGIRFVGGNPDKLIDAKMHPGDLAAFLELHVEQGGVLEEKKKDIGVVEGIVGIKRWMLTFEGNQNHAGTTPMHLRRDALLGASEFVMRSQEMVSNLDNRQVATSGQMTVVPNAPNVIPGKVVVSFETRDLNAKNISEFGARALRLAQNIAYKRKLKLQVDLVYDTAPVRTNQEIEKIIESQAKKLNFSTMRLPSGAGHDAQEMSKVAPMGMIFIPSKGGISHHKDEFSTSTDVGNGAELLLQTILELDQKI